MCRPAVKPLPPNLVQGGGKNTARTLSKEEGNIRGGMAGRRPTQWREDAGQEPMQLVALLPCRALRRQQKRCPSLPRIIQLFLVPDSNHPVYPRDAAGTRYVFLQLPGQPCGNFTLCVRNVHRYHIYIYIYISYICVANTQLPRLPGRSPPPGRSALARAAAAMPPLRLTLCVVILHATVWSSPHPGPSSGNDISPASVPEGGTQGASRYGYGFGAHFAPRRNRLRLIPPPV